MLLLDLLVAVGPVYGYISQLMLIRKHKSLGSFSIYVTAILLISNILRVYFWLTVGFAVNLLAQSGMLIIVQLVLLRDCVELSLHDDSYQKGSFWKWDTFQHYVKFILALTATLTVLTLVFHFLGLAYYGQLVGLLSMSIEATLGLPQLLSNQQTRSVQGLSLTMIGTWFIGDFFKTIYFILEAQPFQFVMCGAVQLTVDVLIILQIIAYSKKLEVKNYDPLGQGE